MMNKRSFGGDFPSGKITFCVNEFFFDCVTKAGLLLRLENVTKVRLYFDLANNYRIFIYFFSIDDIFLLFNAISFSILKICRYL